ncbi:MAG: hypothetical protein ACREIB_09580, partial [Pseudomonadota bacterium]
RCSAGWIAPRPTCPRATNEEMARTRAMGGRGFRGDAGLPSAGSVAQLRQVTEAMAARPTLAGTPSPRLTCGAHLPCKIRARGEEARASLWTQAAATIRRH